MDFSDFTDVINDEQVARALLEANANVNYAKADGWTAMMSCCQNGHEQVCTG